MSFDKGSAESTNITLATGTVYSKFGSVQDTTIGNFKDKLKLNQKYDQKNDRLMNLLLKENKRDKRNL